MEKQSNRPSDAPSGLKRVRSLSYVLDNFIPIPGTPYRVGIDPLLGLLPGGGDMVGGILSVYIVLEATRFGVSRETLTRMVMNLVTDFVVGSLPVLGDLFDVGWKANSRNLALLEAHLNNPQPQRPADRRFAIFMIVVLVLVLVALTSALILFVSWLLQRR